MTEHRDLLPVIIEQEAAVLPDGCDTWAIKSVHADLRTRNGFRWAYPGGTSRSDHAVDRDNTGARPDREGDGLCVAFTWRGMASSSIPARTLLLVAYQSANSLGHDSNKARVAGDVHVVALVDGERLIREHGRGADLRYANLLGVDLQGVDARDANLQGADLRGANLRHADLRGADLRYADLQDADLRSANIRGADLRGADLQDANLRGVDLRGVDLQGVDLRDANLRDVDLQGVDLQGVDLRGVDLRGADLQGADLRGTDLQGVDLQDADLRYANLQAVDLQGANLRDANLRGADLQCAEMYALPAGWGVGEDGRAVRTS